MNHGEQRLRRRLACETLQRRELLAGDFSTAFVGDSSGLVAEGEAAPAVDLVAFAQELQQSDAVLYCADWAAACAQQLAMFEDGASRLPYVEVGTPDRRGNSIASSLGLTSVPTWIMPDDTRITGVASLETLAESLQLEIPLGSQPYLADIQDAVVPTQSPLHIALDAYDPNGEHVTFTVEVDDPSVLTGEVMQENRSLRIELEDYGEMVFQLFEQRAPRPSGRVIQLAEAGFYDGVSFHRIIDGFVIQGGDPTGTGGGGSTLGDFDDQYHLDLQHNTTGILSYAKADDDTGDSQFFVTEGPQRHLDFNHAIFGTLVEGERVREAISRTAASNGRPLFDVRMSQVSVFSDSENAVLLLRPQAVGTTSVTVTATDSDGNSTSKTFQVTVEQDLVNTPPFLAEITDQEFANGPSASFTVSAIDREGDELAYSASVISIEPSTDGVSVSVDDSGVVTVEKPDSFVGEIQLQVTVGQAAGTPSGPGSRFDNQRISLRVVPGHQNQAAPLDVNADGFIVPGDALVIINYLNGSPLGGMMTGSADPGPYRDVNGDLFISPIDALLVVNYLNSQADGEAESDALFASLGEGDNFCDGLTSSEHASGLFSLTERDKKFRSGRE